MLKPSVLCTLLGGAALVACATSGQAAGPAPATMPAARPSAAMMRDSVVVPLMDRQGQRIGTAYVTSDTAGVRIRADVSGLAPGAHGFHIHERGACDAPQFTSAGSHYSPMSREHGYLDPNGPHAGDLPNLMANAQGRVEGYDWTTNRVALTSASLRHTAGSSLVIHAQRDDYLTDGGGGSGDRIACGVISPPAGMR